MDALDVYGLDSIIASRWKRKEGFYVAIKMEVLPQGHPSTVKREYEVLMTMHKECKKTHVINAIEYGRVSESIRFLVMERVGRDLKTLQTLFFANGLPLKDWVRLAIQCLVSIKVGLCREWVAKHEKTGKLVARKARPHVPFRGTPAYAAPSSHLAEEQGRKDDLWSFLYMLIDLYAELPWARVQASLITDNAAEIKMKVFLPDDVLLTKMPSGLLPIPTHLRSLTVYTRPDYNLIHECLLAVMKRHSVSFYEKYEWEGTTMAAKNEEEMRKHRPIYLDPSSFLNSDPLGIMTDQKKRERGRRRREVQTEEKKRGGRGEREKKDQEMKQKNGGATDVYVNGRTKPLPLGSIPPGDIATQPGSKIVFNAPYDINHTYHIKVQSSARRIGWAFKTTNMKRLGVDPAAGVLDPKENALIAVSCDAFGYGQEDINKDRITIEWTNTPVEAAKQFRRAVPGRRNGSQKE